MKFPGEIWTYLIVTLMAVLIWFWAAGETLVQKPMYARVHLAVPDQANWVVSPSEEAINIQVQGSNLSLQNLEEQIKRPLQIMILPTSGRQRIDLIDKVRGLDEIRETGVAILGVEPRAIDVDVDKIERQMVRVKPVLPGVMTEGEIVIEPPEVELSLPSQVQASLPAGWAVEAFVERSELDRLEPGVRHTLEVRLRLSQDLSAQPRVQVNPSRVRLSFVIRSRIRETRLDSVRVHLSGPPEDTQLYDVEIEPKQVLNVTISADADLVRRIEARDGAPQVPVVAMVYLSSSEKEKFVKAGGVGQKRITHFIALADEGARAVQVTGRAGDSTEMPMVTLRITPREAAAQP